MADIVATGADLSDSCILRGCKLDVEFGDTGNDIELTVDAGSGQRVELGAFVYVEGTEYGGVVDKSESDPEDGAIRYTGRSWHGILAGKVVMPPSGQSHRTVSGEANALLLSLIGLLGLGDVMTASAEDSGIEVSSFSYDRFCDGYSGARKMLASAGARLAISYDSSLRKAVLSAVPVRDWAVGPDANDALVTSTRVRRCVNHLVSLGSGEGAARIVRHDYADADGAVSQVQTFTGVDEICEVYDFSSADADQLAERAPERLAGLQEIGGFKAQIDGDCDYAVGETVPGVDLDTGSTVMVPVASKIAVVTDSEIAVEFRAGDVPGAASAASYS